MKVCAAIVAWTVFLADWILAQPSQQVYQYTINRSVFVNDSLQYDVESLFPNLSRDLRTLEAVPEDEQILKVSNKLSPRYYTNLVLIHACKHIIKTSWLSGIASCVNKNLVEFSVSPQTQYITVGKVFAQDMNLTNPVSALVWNPYSSSVYVHTVTYNRLPIGFEHFHSIYVYSSYRSKDAIAYYQFKSRENLVGTIKHKLLVTFFDNKMRLIIYNYHSRLLFQEEKQPFFFTTYLIDSETGVISPEIEWSQVIKDPKQALPEAAPQQKLIMGIDPAATLILIEETETCLIILLADPKLPTDTEETVKQIYMQLCIFENQESIETTQLVCGQKYIIGEFTSADGKHNELSFAGFYYYFEVKEDFIEVKKIITITTSHIKKWSLTDDNSLLLVNEISVKDYQLTFIAVKTITVDNNNKIVAVLQRDISIHYVIITNFDNGIVRMYRDQLVGDRFVFFKEGVKGTEDAMLTYYDMIPPPPKIAMYIYHLQAEIIWMNFKSLNFANLPALNYNVTFLADNSSCIQFNLEIIKDPKALPNKGLWKDLIFYRDTQKMAMYLPYESVDLRVNAPRLQLKNGDNSSYNIELSDTHFIEASNIDFFIKDNATKTSPIYLEYLARDSRKVLTYSNFTLIQKVDWSLELLHCIGMNTRRSIRCTSVFSEFFVQYPQEEPETIVDFFCNIDTSETLTLMLLSSYKNNTRLSIYRREKPELLPSLIRSCQFSLQIVYSSMRMNSTHVLLISISRVYNAVATYKIRDNIVTIPIELKTLDFNPNPTEDIRMWAQLPHYLVEDYVRSSFNGFMITKIVEDKLFVYNYTFSDSWERVLLSTFSVPLGKDDYKKIKLCSNVLLVLDIKMNKLMMWSKPFETGEEKLYIETPPLTADDVLMTVTSGRTGFMATSTSLLALDLSGGESDPMKRLIQTLKLKTDILTIKDSITNLTTEIWLMNNPTYSTMFGIVLVKNGTQLKSSTGFILDLFGPSYYVELGFERGTSRNSLAEYTLSNPAISDQSKVVDMHIYLKAYCKQIVVAPKPLPLKQPDFTSGNQGVYFINDLIEINTHVAGYGIEQPQKVAEVTQAIIRLKPNDPRMQAVPDRLLEEDERGATVGLFTFIIGNSTMELLMYNIGHRVFRSCLNLTLDFNHTNIIFPEPRGTAERFITVFFTVQERFDIYSIVAYTFDQTNPRKYFVTKTEWACACRNPFIQIITEGEGFIKFGLLYLKLNETGNALVTGLLDLRWRENEAETAYEEAKLTYSDSIYIQQVPYRITTYNLLSSEKVLLQYFFMQNSGYIGVISLRFNDQDQIEHSSYRLRQFSEAVVLSRNSLLDCKQNSQELTISCIFFTPSDRTKIWETTFRFDLESDQMVVPKVEYILQYPTQYKALRLFKRTKIDLVLAQDESQNLCILFFNPSTELIFQELCEPAFRENFLKNLTNVYELMDNTFAMGAVGFNMKEMVFERVNPTIRVLPDYYKGQHNYLGYRLVIDGIYQGEQFQEKIPLHSFFLLETKKDYLEIIIAFAVILLTGSLAVILAHYANSKNTAYDKTLKEVRQRKLADQHHHSSQSPMSDFVNTDIMALDSILVQDREDYTHSYMKTK